MWAKIRGWLRLVVKEYNSLIYFLKISKLVPVNTFLLNLYNLKWRFQGSSQPRHTNNLPFPYFDRWICLKTVSTYVLTDILPSFFIFLVLDTGNDWPSSKHACKNVVDLSEVQDYVRRDWNSLDPKECCDVNCVPIFWILSPLSYL